ncbi:MAG: family 20 glycosylhydrolase [Oscillospiraceae bacterium]|nr:family 20 glycosylhydrolase [Oscillospiraceae bacterium]
MLNLIPAVKVLKIGEGYLSQKAISFDSAALDSRLVKALKKLPLNPRGAKLTISLTGGEGESYTLQVAEDSICITAPNARGAFYGIQTLRQLFTGDKIPCLEIQDEPDFPHRGFYHDITRGRISTLETLLQLVEDMAYYKLNSLQLYVEHVFPFRETAELIQTTGCITPEELEAVQVACEEHFIEFIPSLSTFGHMYEILELPRFKPMAVLSDFKTRKSFWDDRQRHHTLNPLAEGSEALVESLIDQYYPLFRSNFFNICCDETFDLDMYLDCEDPGKVYADFVKKIIGMIKARGKDVMMWADILLKHPEVIDDIPEDTIFLNWNYRKDPPEDCVAQLAQTGRKQIVCPGNSAWYRLCEDVEVEEGNISQMAHYGKKYGALGILNTNWGDWGHPANLELGMYGLVLGAEKSWSEATPVDEAFYTAVNHLLYKQPGALQLLKTIAPLQRKVTWKMFMMGYFFKRYGEEARLPWEPVAQADLEEIQGLLPQIRQALSGTWERDEFRREMLCAAEGICLMAELSAKLDGREVTYLVDGKKWLADYAANWLRTNKPNELQNILDVFTWCLEQ